MRLSVSIFIRARNEATALGATLDAIAQQRRVADEVVVLDNESTDDTQAVAREHGAVLHKISTDEFSYGGALNRAVALTRGEIVVFLSAHSPPVDNTWLSVLVEPLEQGLAQASFGRQVPVAGVNHLEEWVLYRTFPKHPMKLLSWIRVQANSFSNANAAILKRVLRRHPFREDLPFAEDIAWVREVGERGLKIQYCPSAAVFHSHRHDGGRLENRMRASGLAMRQLGIGRIYRWRMPRLAVIIATIGVDVAYCLARGYWGTVPIIVDYRRRYFRGLFKGLGVGSDVGQVGS